MKRPVWLLLRIGFGVAGIAFIALALAHTWSRTRAHALPSWERLVAALALVALALRFGSRGWTALLDDAGSPRGLARGFYVSQLGKYIPGAVWQAFALVGAARADVGLARASTAFPVYVLSEAVAGASVAAFLALAGTHLALWIRLTCLLGICGIVLLHRRWMTRASRVIARLVRLRMPDELVPSQRAIVRSYVWNVAAIVTNGFALALLLTSLTHAVSSTAVAAAFGLAWTVGFLAVPFPSGVGVREAVLVGTVGVAGAGPVIAASIAHRLVTIVAEMALAGAGAIRRPRAA